MKDLFLVEHILTKKVSLGHGACISPTINLTELMQEQITRNPPFIWRQVIWFNTRIHKHVWYRASY